MNGSRRRSFCKHLALLTLIPVPRWYGHGPWPDGITRNWITAWHCPGLGVFGLILHMAKRHSSGLRGWRNTKMVWLSCLRELKQKVSMKQSGKRQVAYFSFADASASTTYQGKRRHGKCAFMPSGILASGHGGHNKSHGARLARQIRKAGALR